jgi:cytochrome P450
MSPVDPDKVDLWALLQNQQALDQIGAQILSTGPRAIRFREPGPDGKSMVFVAHNNDVAHVLTDEKRFSLRHYDPLYSSVAPPGATIIMRPDGKVRKERLEILHAAADKTPWFTADPTRRRQLARACVDNIVDALRDRQCFDLIGEYGFFAPYLVAKRVIGLPGPRTFSLLPLLICLVNGHPIPLLLSRETGPYLTELAWSEVVVAQLLSNFENRFWPMRVLARCAATRLRRQVEGYIDAFPEAAGEETLLHALWAVRDEFPLVNNEVYRDHVVSILMELVSTILVVPGSGFTGIVERWLAEEGPGLAGSLERLTAMDATGEAERVMREELRLAPPATHLLRNATAQLKLGGLIVDHGEYVCALIKSAGQDVANPGALKMARQPATYLQFGPMQGPHLCFGHRLAPSLLTEMFLGLSRLPNMTPRGKLTARLGLVPGRWMVELREPELMWA